jgi:surface protein
LWWVGLSFFSFVALSFAVFYDASAFNQDVSKWNTGAVTDMRFSKCILSLSLSVATPSAVVFLNIRQLESQVSHVLLFFVVWNGTFLFQSVPIQWFQTNIVRW